MITIRFNFALQSAVFNFLYLRGCQNHEQPALTSLFRDFILAKAFCYYRLWFLKNIVKFSTDKTAFSVLKSYQQKLQLPIGS
jgi:hypothetical protein